MFKMQKAIWTHLFGRPSNELRLSRQNLHNTFCFLDVQLLNKIVVFQIVVAVLEELLTP